MATTNPFSLTTGGVQNIYGTGAGSEFANVSGLTPTRLDQNIESANFLGPSSNYNFYQQGNEIVVTDKATGNIVSTVATPRAGTQFTFSSGSPLTFTPTRTDTGFQINMGSTPLSQYTAPTGGLSAANNATSGASNTVTPTGGLSAATVADQTGGFVRPAVGAGGLEQVFGTTSQDTATLQAGAGPVKLDQLVDSVKLPGNYSDYDFSQQGNQVLVKDKSGNLVANVATALDGTTLKFADNTSVELMPTKTATGYQINMARQGATGSPTNIAQAPLDIGASLATIAGQDNAVSFEDIVKFAERNNLNLNQISSFLGDPSNRSGLMSDLSTYQTQYDFANQTYNPEDVNWYGIENAKFNLEEGRGPTDFSRSNLATQLEAWRQGLYDIPELRGYSEDTGQAYLTSAASAARQAVPSANAKASNLVDTLTVALQNPTMDNLKTAYDALYRPADNMRASNADIAQANAYIQRLTGNPTATYKDVLDQATAGFAFSPSREDTREDLLNQIDMLLSLTSDTDKTRGAALARRIGALEIEPEVAASVLGISLLELQRLAGGDPAMWDRIRNNQLGGPNALFAGEIKGSRPQIVIPPKSGG